MGLLDDRMTTSARTAARLLAELAGFAVLLFITRFVARGHLITHTDEMCHVGAIAVDVLAHGIRFPLLAYAPVEYNNGSLFSGLLVAVFFSLFGRSVLVLKLVPHLITAGGAVASLWLLRGCLEELGLTGHRVRWVATATLVIAIALAPLVVTAESMATIGFGSPAEGTPINTILLALFASRPHLRSAARTAALWTLAGFAFYLNKGTLLILPVLCAAELALAWPSRRRLAAAFGGFVLGELLDLLALSRRSIGWPDIFATAQRRAGDFPFGFIDSVTTLADNRFELVVLWAMALGVGIALLVRSLMRLRRRGWHGSDAGLPVSLALVVAVAWLHLFVLSVMAQGGFDGYAVYGYPTLTVLVAVLIAVLYSRAASLWGESAAAWIGVAMMAALLVFHRPDAISSGLPTIAALWRNEAGAACSWHLAESFEREHQYRLAPPGRTREQHAIERCRSLSEPAQILDCICGIARTMHSRRTDKVQGEPPAELSDAERRAFAYCYGIHQAGNVRHCDHFTSPALAAECVAAVHLECLILADINTRFFTGSLLSRPQCPIPPPPMDGYWSAARLDLLARTGGVGPHIDRWLGREGIARCGPVFAACYEGK